MSYAPINCKTEANFSNPLQDGAITILLNNECTIEESNPKIYLVHPDYKTDEQQLTSDLIR